jgi:membrane protein required for colicin V production
VNWLDFVLLAVAVASTAAGLARGMARMVVGIVAAVVAIVLSLGFYQSLGARFCDWGLGKHTASIAAFALIFVLVIAVGGAVAALLAKLLRVVGLGFLDRLAGGFLGFVRGVVIAIVVIMVMMAFTLGPPPAAVQDSRFAPHLLWASTFIARMAPAELRDAYEASRRKLLDAWEELSKAMRETHGDRF